MTDTDLTIVRMYGDTIYGLDLQQLVLEYHHGLLDPEDDPWFQDLHDFAQVLDAIERNPDIPVKEDYVICPSVAIEGTVETHELKRVTFTFLDIANRVLFKMRTGL